jgi:hypothetical protein
MALGVLRACYVNWLLPGLECRTVVVPDGTMTTRHTGHVTTHYVIYHPLDLYYN